MTDLSRLGNSELVRFAGAMREAAVASMEVYGLDSEQYNDFAMEAREALEEVSVRLGSPWARVSHHDCSR